MYIILLIDNENENHKTSLRNINIIPKKRSQNSFAKIFLKQSRKIGRLNYAKVCAIPKSPFMQKSHFHITFLPPYDVKIPKFYI